jgi:hypothetical protein
MPHLAGVADELCFLHAVQVDNPAHDLATLQFNTGVITEVRPSMGAWISYGLGTENANLPSYISIHADSDVIPLTMGISSPEQEAGFSFFTPNHLGNALGVRAQPVAAQGVTASHARTGLAACVRTHAGCVSVRSGR